MADVVRTTRKQSLQTAGVIAGTALSINALFYLASHFYYDGKPLQAMEVGRVRIAFGALSLIVAASAYGAALAPRLIGHALAFLAGVASLVGGIAALAKGLPPVMGATLIVVGATLPALAWRSLQLSRSAWAFAIAILAMLATVSFFGAPKIRALLGIGLWFTLIIPALQLVGMIALAMVRDEYRDRR